MTHAFTYCALICLILSSLLVPALARADTQPPQIHIPAAQVLITYAEGYQETITSLRFDDLPAQTLVVFPVPSQPEVDQLPAGTELFTYLEEATWPVEQVVERLVWERTPGSTAPAPATTEAPRAPELLDDYEITRLPGTGSRTLETWLETHDYTFPADVQPLLDAYSEQGWQFVLVRLTDNAVTDGVLAPLRMRFATDEIVYPLPLSSLTSQPLEVQVYLLTYGRMQMEPLETVYAGPVAQLDPPPSASLAPQLTQAPYLTTFHAAALDPQGTRPPLVAHAAPTDAAYRKVVTTYTEIPLRHQSGILLALFCLVVMNLVTVTVALSFKRRFEAISPERG
ncbi:MAG: DUF2330 domain-containing protein [Chloroflexaceae bacterium]